MPANIDREKFQLHKTKVKLCPGILRGEHSPECAGFTPSSVFLGSQAVYLSPRSGIAFSSMTQKIIACSGKLSFPPPSMCQPLLGSQNSHHKPASYLPIYLLSISVTWGKGFSYQSIRRQGCREKLRGEFGDIAQALAIQSMVQWHIRTPGKWDRLELFHTLQARM